MSDTVNAYGVGKTVEDEVLLAFFDGTNYEHGANIDPEIALEIASDLRRHAKNIQEESDNE